MFFAKIVDRQFLTRREAQVLEMVAAGAVDKEIARRLAISIKTVEAHISHINDKIGDRSASINSRARMIGEAVARGMLRISSTSLTVLLMLGVMGLDDQQSLRVRIRVNRNVSHVVRVRGDA